jgi:CelD/BcsL family acetyltransferase involved in cellulose biosynthesis
MTDIQLTTVDRLSAEDRQAWREIQAASPAYSSPYFCLEFAEAVATVRADVEVARLEQGGQRVGFFPFQRGKLNLGKPLGGKLSDYHGPLVREGVEFDPRSLLAACRLASWDFDHLATATKSLVPHVTKRDQSPQMDLSEGYEVFARARHQAGSDTIAKQGRKTRKMAREAGPLAFTFDADDDEAFGLLRSWKSSQYLRTGLADVFSFPWTLALLEKLRERRGPEFSAPLSVLRAGGKIAAVCLSLRSRGVLHSWFNAYNPQLDRYSPGLALFIRLAEEARGLGIRTIDLGKGDERYKSSLANAYVPLGEGSIACPSLATWLRSGWRIARNFVSRTPLKETVRLPGKLVKPLREWLAYH